MSQGSRFNTRTICRIAIMAALYVLLTMVSIAMVYVDQPKAEILAIALFAAAAAPTAAIVLIQGNPFQPPSAASAAPIASLAGR